MPAIVEATPDSPSWAVEAVVEPINLSLENDGDIIYNGSDEKFAVPTLGKTRSMFSEVWESNQEVTSYPNATRMVLIDLDRIDPSEQESILAEHLDKKTLDVWKACKMHKVNTKQFVEHAAAIHIDCNEDGNEFWFEMIVNGL